MHRPAHIGFAHVLDRTVVLLDTRADRYRQLPPAMAEALIEGPGGRHDDMLAEMIDREFLVTGPGPSIWPAFETPTDSALDARAPAERVSLWACAGGLLATRRRLRRQGLGLVLARLRRRRAVQHLRSAPPAAARLARGFRTIRQRLPVRRVCLEDSLILSDLLAAKGLASEMIFGVRLDPFSAHCWVQAGDLLLSDPLGKIAEFTPVLSV